MRKLITELKRLYLLAADSTEPEELPEEFLATLDGQGAFSINSLGKDELVRVMLLHFSVAADWPVIQEFYQRLVLELELPPPAISVSGEQGYTLWFSLRVGVPRAQAESFLAGLRARLLAELPSHHLVSCPSSGVPFEVPLTPALNTQSGRWSVFIDPCLGGMFMDQSGLDIQPNPDHQAELLAGLKSIELSDFHRLLRSLAPNHRVMATQSDCLATPGKGMSADPKAFLEGVMNDAGVPLKLRIKAAKSLLPFLNR